MSYVIGLDVGTTYTAAAVLRGDERPEVVQLGNRAAAIPSVVFVREGTMLVGDAAVRRGLTEPIMLAREFKRRIGDPAPILLGGVPLSAESLFARLLRWTVDVVVEREGGPPERVAVCHPANWGPYKLELLAQACRMAELNDVVLITEPEAAATQYAALERVEPGARVAVYDLGGGTFDAAVLRKTGTGFEILGTPEGIERLGGIDFDEAVVGHVRSAIGPALDRLDADDPATVASMARVRQECVEAKEALSADVEASIPVVLPGLQTEVRLTRAEFEAMIRVPLLETIAALRRALRNAAVEPEDLAAVLLVGGSSRIPMVAEMVGVELRRPVAVDSDPKHVVALGAARAAAHREAVSRSSVPQPPAPAIAQAPAAPAAPVATPAAASAAPAAPLAPAPPASAPTPPRPAASPPMPPHPAPSSPSPYDPVAAHDAPRTTPSRAPTLEAPVARTARPPRGLLIGVAIALVVLLGGGVAAFALLGGGSGNEQGFVSPCPGSGHPAVCITSVAFDGNDLAVQFTTHDLDAVRSVFQGGQVGTVFFLASINESQAGSQVATGRTDAWLPWSSQPPFTGTNAAGQHGFTAGTIGDAATAVCVLLGDANGRVLTNTGNCAELPPSP